MMRRQRNYWNDVITLAGRLKIQMIIHGPEWGRREMRREIPDEASEAPMWPG